MTGLFTRRLFRVLRVTVATLLVTAPLVAQSPQRIVSLVPNLTEMLFAIGAGPHVVAVSSFDREPEAVRALPRVGALLDPDVERILSLRPDLVVTYGSQTELKAQLARTGIAVFDYRHGGLADALTTLRALGVRTGHAREAETLARRLEQQIAATRARVAGRTPPRTLLVFGREPGSLRNIYAVGGTGFLHDMLEAAGGRNVLADVPRESVQVTTETILSRAPDVILEIRGATDPVRAGVSPDLSPWKTLASVPAVRGGRVVVLSGAWLTVPGPRVGDAIDRFAAALHP
jgi:iron complex transport system substrate-binding protein